MAATKRNAMLIAETRFYVYRLIDGEAAAYVGKGSGRRLENQMRAFGLPGEIVKRFKREDDAFAYERKLIAELTPTLNRCPGGNGGRAEKCKPYRRDAFDRLIAKLGTRVYAARLWLNCAKAAPHLVDPSKVDAMKAVAYGCGA
jgi:hypothetical protein